jgi:hypothetical protein
MLAGVLGIGGCDADEPPPVPEDSKPAQVDSCQEVNEGGSDLPADFRVAGRALAGDVTGDGRVDRVTLRTSERRPRKCRSALVVESGAGKSMAVVVDPLDWPSRDPKLLLLAQIEGRPGLETVVALSPGAVFRPGGVFTVADGKLIRMRLGGKDSGTQRLFPFYDEFPTGVDCTDLPREIVVTVSQFAPRRDDSVFGITRTFYRPEGATFWPKGRKRLVVDCCNEEAKRRWPETADDPFRSCPDLVE